MAIRKEVKALGMPWEDQYGYAQAVKVEDTIYVFGQLGHDRGRREHLRRRFTRRYGHDPRSLELGSAESSDIQEREEDPRRIRRHAG